MCCHLASKIRPGALVVARTGPCGLRAAMSTLSCVWVASVVTMVHLSQVKVPVLFHLVPCRAMASTRWVPASLSICCSRPVPRLLTLKLHSRNGAKWVPRGWSLRDAPPAEASGTACSCVSWPAPGAEVPAAGPPPLAPSRPGNPQVHRLSAAGGAWDPPRLAPKSGAATVVSGVKLLGSPLRCLYCRVPCKLRRCPLTV